MYETQEAHNLLEELKERAQGEVADGAADPFMTTSLRYRKLLFTGTLETVTRSEAKALALSAGATVKTSIVQDSALIVVIGSCPGARKLEKIAAKGLTTMTEAEFLTAVANSKTAN